MDPSRVARHPQIVRELLRKSPPLTRQAAAGKFRVIVTPNEDDKKMADQSPQRSRRSNKPLGDTATIFAGLQTLASTIGLLALCSGCHLSGERPGSIKFLQPDASFSNSQVSAPRTANPSLIGRSPESSTPLGAQTRPPQAAGISSKQKSDSAKIGLVSYLQDDEPVSGRLQLDPQSGEPITPDDVEVEVEADTDEVDIDEADIDEADIDEAEEVSEGELEAETEAQDSDSDDLADSQFTPQAPPEPNVNTGGVPVDAVLQSTLNFYPEIQVVLEELTIANGNQIQAEGSFDTKFKIDSENTPIGFYETYRNKFDC